MLGSLHPTRDFTYVEETVRGLVEVAKSDDSIGEVINIGSGKEISIGDLANLILGLTGNELDPLKDEKRVRPEKSEVDRLMCDNSKARKYLGWEPQIELREGLKRTIDWFKEHAHEYREAYSI